MSIEAMSAKPKLATLSSLVTPENTGQTKTSETLVQIEFFLDQSNQEVMYFIKMYSVFTVTFSRSGESSVKPNILPTYGVRPGAARVLGGGLRRQGGVVVGRHGCRVVDLLWLLDVRGLGR